MKQVIAYKMYGKVWCEGCLPIPDFDPEADINSWPSLEGVVCTFEERLHALVCAGCGDVLGQPSYIDTSDLRHGVIGDGSRGAHGVEVMAFNFLRSLGYAFQGDPDPELFLLEDIIDAVDEGVSWFNGMCYPEFQIIFQDGDCLLVGDDFGDEEYE